MQIAFRKPELEEESLELKLAATEREPVQFLQRQGSQVKRYVLQADGEYVVEETELSHRIPVLREYGRDASFPPVSAVYRFIDGWRFLDVDVKAARESAVSGEAPVGIPRLSDDASNLSERFGTVWRDSGSPGAFYWRPRGRRDCSSAFSDWRTW